MSAVDELIGSLYGIPLLHSARCKGRSDIWDSFDDPALVEYAIQQCQSCAAKADCERYFLSLKPRHRPVGVIAGRVNKPPPPRKRKQTAA
jgi:hypothetical protein